MYVIEGFRPFARRGARARRVKTFRSTDLELARAWASAIFETYGVVVAIEVRR